MSMTKSDIKANWQYFSTLANQLKQTEQFVDHSLNSDGDFSNGLTFSNEFAKILLLTASEFEIISKSLCNEAGAKISTNANIIQISKQLLKLFPHIIETKICTPYKTIIPLYGWKIIKELDDKGKEVEKVDGLEWWYAHNGIKHNRFANYTSANLINCIEAMASLMVLELYLAQIVLGNVNSITLECSYFSCAYGLKYLTLNTGKELPDFINASSN